MPNKKSPTKAKSPSKPKMKAAPKAKAAKAKAPAKFPVKHHGEKPVRGFMWKVLEQKQAEQKERGNLPPGHMPESENNKFHDEPGHSRFNGPRRRVG